MLVHLCSPCSAPHPPRPLLSLLLTERSPFAIQLRAEINELFSIVDEVQPNVARVAGTGDVPHVVEQLLVLVRWQVWESSAVWPRPV